MQLIYRGHSYTCAAPYTKPACQPRAINWRYRLPGAAQMEPQIKTSPVNLSAASRSVQPRAINWRYQIPRKV